MEFKTLRETVFSEPDPVLAGPEPELPFGQQPRRQADLSSRLQEPGAGRRDREERVRGSGPGSAHRAGSIVGAINSSLGL